jgi:hypothetical protein
MSCIFPECKVTAGFNFKTEKIPKYCTKHKLEGMIDVKHKTCEYEGCKVLSNYNYEGERKAKYCVTHKLEGMIDVQNKPCEYEGCKIQPVYNFETERKGKYCVAHKLEGMVDIRSKKCAYEGCKIKPVYNYEGERKAKYCVTHKLEDMIDIRNKTCEYEGCKIRPAYNFEGERKGKYCVTHKLEDMIDIRNKTCEYEGCKIRPVYNYEGENKGKYCVTHKLEGMINIKDKKCKTHLCNTIVTKKYEGYCLFCYINTFPDKPVSRNFKTKEKTVVDFVLENFGSLSITTDKRVEGGCSKRRPDILINLGHRIIIIEIDENQHMDYDCSCENKRIMELYQDLDYRSIIFIRFNPDDYINEKGENIKSCWSPNGNGILRISKNKQKEWNLRLESLKNQIIYWNENESFKAIEIIHLYYDVNMS